MSKLHNHTYSPSLSTDIYFIKYIGKTQYIGLDTTYIKVKQYSTDNAPSSTFTILFPPIYNTSTLKVGEIVELHSEDFFWNRNGYYIPTLKFKECKSFPIKGFHQQTGNADTIQSPTNDINTNLSMIERNNDVKDQRVLNVSWNKVIFRNGNVIFSSPYADKGGKGKIISWKDSLADFELIKPALQKKIPSITIKLSKWDIIEVINFDEITNAIISLKKSAITHKPDVVIKKTRIKVLTKPKRMSSTEVKNMHEVKSSKYLKELCNLHLKEFPIFYCVETKNTTSGNSAPEKAFIFCLRETETHLTIIYENVLESRSSYIFIIQRRGFIGTINKIHNFFSSSIENKREKLAIDSVEFPPKVFSYHRIIHNTFEIWRNEVLRWQHNIRFM